MLGSTIRFYAQQSFGRFVLRSTFGRVLQKGLLPCEPLFGGGLDLCVHCDSDGVTECNSRVFTFTLVSFATCTMSNGFASCQRCQMQVLHDSVMQVKPYWRVL